MAKLRIYWMNGGNMPELVRCQKREKPASGAQEVIYPASEMLAMEHANQRMPGKLADLPVYNIPYLQIKNMAALKNHIGGL